ncbi:hypothetical protein R1flu_017625 [Riccia fluitans]|uniref:Protein kinase domain-containing protein n=1 Tax=Riccia fluitans TaxID=41844 RepID=A0ABD1ZDP8_9MARC
MPPASSAAKQFVAFRQSQKSVGVSYAYCGVGCQNGPCFNKGGGGVLGTGAIIGIVFGSAFIVFLGLLIIILRIRRKRMKKLGITSKGGHDMQKQSRDDDDDDPGKELAIDAGPILGMRYSFEFLNDATNGFAKELGRGAFGVVYKGVLLDGSEVAVKELVGHRAIKDFEVEVRTLGNINHANLVALRGFCLKRNHPLLVYEYVPNGSLDKWIFSKEKLLSWQTRVDVARGTARGLSYLHEELQIGQAIIHLDIKPENILLTEKFVPKVADFGMVKLLGQTKTKTIVCGGTFGYMAPEVYTGAVTPKMDVYSFGMVLLELVAGRRQLDYSLPDDRFFLPAWVVRKAFVHSEVDIVDPRLEGDFSEEQAQDLITIALLCLQRDPGSRPDIRAVFKMLEGWKVPRELPQSLVHELERTERLVRRPSQPLRLRSDSDSFFIDFGSDRSSQRRLDEGEPTSDDIYIVPSSESGRIASLNSSSMHVSLLR